LDYTFYFSINFGYLDLSFYVFIFFGYSDQGV